jgi:hypothetical protein
VQAEFNDDRWRGAQVVITVETNSNVFGVAILRFQRGQVAPPPGFGADEQDPPPG